jgi:hypothetical protein
MAACIYNEPGTIYTILSRLTGDDNDDNEDAPKFDLNIEYLRAEDLRIADYYAIEICGTYTTTTDPMAASQGNICGIVFYGDSLPRHVDRKMKKLGLTKSLKEKVREEAYGPDAPSGGEPERHAAYSNSTKPENCSMRLPTIRSCPISRMAMCPTLKNPTKGDDRLRARIQVLVRNVPGALCKTLELLGVP